MGTCRVGVPGRVYILALMASYMRSLRIKNDGQGWGGFSFFVVFLRFFFDVDHF